MENQDCQTSPISTGSSKSQYSVDFTSTAVNSFTANMLSFGECGFTFRAPAKNNPFEASSSTTAGETLGYQVNKKNETWLATFAEEENAFTKCESSKDFFTRMTPYAFGVLKPSNLDWLGMPQADATDARTAAYALQKKPYEKPDLWRGVGTYEFQLAPTPPGPQTFHCFPKLPGELRNMIWKWALPGSRQVVLYPATNLIPEGRYPQFLDYIASYKQRFQLRSTAPNPPTLYVNKESRSFSMKYYRKIFSRSQCIGLTSIWIDHDLDVVIFSADCFVYNFEANTAREDRGEFGELQLFANSFLLPGVPQQPVINYYRAVRMVTTLRAIMSFPTLQKVVIREDGCGRNNDITRHAIQHVTRYFLKKLKAPLEILSTAQIPEYKNLNDYRFEYY